MGKSSLIQLDLKVSPEGHLLCLPLVQFYAAQSQRLWVLRHYLLINLKNIFGGSSKKRLFAMLPVFPGACYSARQLILQ